MKQLKMNKQLIIYYSHSGVTRNLAHKIQKLTGADIYEIKSIEPYPNDVYATIEIFKQELREKSTKPIKTPDINWENYDTIFIGTPNWGNTVATPYLDFFASVDIHDKNIIPFVTHGGGGVGKCASDIIKLSNSTKNSTPLVTGRSMSDLEIENWLINIKQEQSLLSANVKTSIN